MSDARRLSLDLHPSRVLATWILAIHAVAGACVLVAWPGLPGGAVALLFCALGIAVAWRVALLRGPASIRSLELTDTGEGSASLGGGARLALAASPRHVTRFWVIVPAGQPARRLLVASDMLSADQFRRLRVWALWGGIAAAAPALA
ncbi:MAG: protein YgfX [Burkholderiales bacterium]